MPNIFNRPMFKLGGKPNSDGVGITSGLNRRGYAFGNVQGDLHGNNNLPEWVKPWSNKYGGKYEEAVLGAMKGMDNMGKVSTPEMAMMLSNVLGQGGSIYDMITNAQTEVMPKYANYKKIQSQLPGAKAGLLKGLTEMEFTKRGLDIKEMVATRPLEKDRALEINRQADQMRLDALSKYGTLEEIPQEIRDEFESLKIIALGGAFMSTSMAYAKALDLIGKIEGELDADDKDRINKIVALLTGQRWGGQTGGRVGRAYGNPDPTLRATEAIDIQTPGMNEEMVATETMQAPNPSNDPFVLLRARLPKEITDDVVKLIAYNPEAFKDFAAIENQQDVINFNQTYGVELVIPTAQA